jgi:hypothetical protein
VTVATVAKPGDAIEKYHSYGNVLFVSDDCEDMCRMIELINNTIHIINEREEDVVIKYTDSNYLKSIYQKGLNGE